MRDSGFGIRRRADDAAVRFRALSERARSHTHTHTRSSTRAHTRERRGNNLTGLQDVLPESQGQNYLSYMCHFRFTAGPASERRLFSPNGLGVQGLGVSVPFSHLLFSSLLLSSLELSDTKVYEP